MKCEGIAAHFRWSSETLEEWWPKALAAWKAEQEEKQKPNG